MLEQSANNIQSMGSPYLSGCMCLLPPLAFCKNTKVSGCAQGMNGLHHAAPHSSVFIVKVEITLFKFCLFFVAEVWCDLRPPSSGVTGNQPPHDRRESGNVNLL